MFAGIGERSREGLELWNEMQRRGVLDRTALMFGQMKETPGARFMVGEAALSIAEHFRDELGRNVMFVVDNLYRHVQAGMEVSGLLGRMPSRVGYQPTLAADLAAMEERITGTRHADMIAAQAIYGPADDYGDPAVTHAFWHIDSAQPRPPASSRKFADSNKTLATLGLGSSCAPPPGRRSRRRHRWVHRRQRRPCRWRTPPAEPRRKCELEQGRGLDPAPRRAGGWFGPNRGPMRRRPRVTWLCSCIRSRMAPR